MIIGVSGLNGAGKGALVDYLVDRSFAAFSLSDVVREELARQGNEENRERMIECGRALRRAGGAGALAEALLPRLGSGLNYAIDSIRHPAEVEVLAAFSPQFRLLWVEASEDVRLARMQRRSRAGDPNTLDELRELEARERSSSEAAGQQLDPRWPQFRAVEVGR